MNHKLKRISTLNQNEQQKHFSVALFREGVKKVVGRWTDGQLHQISLFFSWSQFIQICKEIFLLVGVGGWGDGG